mgnify:FL=1|tara:strand:+ start:761 stop:886 length:126 start_codon:yes stop_codon:yes gene_type:complete
MTKKIIIIIFLGTLIISCGKKGDPVFKEKNSKIFENKIAII